MPSASFWGGEGLDRGGNWLRGVCNVVMRLPAYKRLESMCKLLAAKSEALTMLLK